MRNKLHAAISIYEKELTFVLYEIDDSAPHHHIVRYRQALALGDMDGLIADLKSITEQMIEWKLILEAHKD